MRIAICTITLSASAPAWAGLAGISVEDVPNEFGILTCRVYADFTNADDRVVGVCGTPDAPLAIGVDGGSFFQHAFGTDAPPQAKLITVAPSLAFDTFVTIGLAVAGTNDEMFFTPGWPGFGAGELSATNAGWFVTPVSPQGAAEGRVLLGQFSTTDGAGISGTFNLEFVTDDEPWIATVAFCHPADGPCVDGDVTLDNLINTEDFLTLLGCWGDVGDGEPACALAGAIAGDPAVIDVLDLLSLLASWTPIEPVPTEGVNADLNGDGVVNIADLLVLLTCQGPPEGSCEVADIDGDGTIGVNDLILLIGNWGPV